LPILPRTFESARPTSSTTSAYDTKSRPMPPCSSGIVAPRKPTSASLPTIAGSTASARSHSVANGAISESQNSRAVRRMSCCSSVSSRSTDETLLRDVLHDLAGAVGVGVLGDVRLGDDAHEPAVLLGDRQPPHLVLGHQPQSLVEILLRVDRDEVLRRGLVDLRGLRVLAVG